MAASSVTCPLPLAFRYTSDLIPKLLDPQTPMFIKLMQWDADGQENSVCLNLSRPASGLSDMLEVLQAPVPPRTCLAEVIKPTV